ncbi:MAG: cytochrome b N-terminal domain-containing protein [Candidatus Marinimicrobia bacterium]|nr:cytochrome b N-terminal domain-containing protein [Candidatus Neomarinimicrobiota bacterium]
MSATRWLKERFPIDYDKFIEINEKLFIKEPIPLHMKKWLFAMGTTPFLLFPIQIITGILLAFYFVPSPEMAHESVRYITEEVRVGFWVRGLHHWGANLMVITLFLHMMRVFFTQSYRRPRELNWVIGFILLMLTLTISFTGYSLTYNQVSYWATTVGTNMVQEVPLVGSLLLGMLRGGPEVTTNTLTRFYTLHVWVLPLIIVLLIVVHIIILRVHGVSEPEGYKKGYYAFYPIHFGKIVITTLFLLSLMSLLSVVLPPGIGEPADPMNTPLHIKPEWYFFPVFLFLKLVPLNVGMLITGLAILGMVFWPFLEPLLSKDEKRRSIIGYIIGSFTIVILIVFTLIQTFTL